MIASAPVAEPRRDVVRIGHDALFPQQGRESGDNILSCHGTVLCLGIHRRFNLWPIASASQKGFDLFHSVLLLFTASAAEPVQWAQLTIEQRVIIRVPMARKGRAPARRSEERSVGKECFSRCRSRWSPLH